MNTIKLTLTILSIVFSTSAFALGNDNVHISGSYNGTIEHRKVHVKEGKQIEDLNKKSYDVKLTFNHDKFVFQDGNLAYSGTFEAVDGVLYLKVAKIKGDASYDLRDRIISYSLKDKELKLYSAHSAEGELYNQDIVFLNLRKI